MSSIELVKGVGIIHWNPHERLSRRGLARFVRVPSRKNNFGDLLGPIVADLMTQRMDRPSSPNRRLLTIGSIIHCARTGDVVWGSGVNGKVGDGLHRFAELDIRSVRGPRTRAFLRARGLDVPAVYGDPALLLPALRPDLCGLRTRPAGTLLVPNLNDVHGTSLSEVATVLNPRSAREECLRAIVSSDLVISSSLHGIVVAEAFGVPVVPVAPLHESAFKYNDYFEGTGRPSVVVASDFKTASLEPVPTPALIWDPAPLVEAFPWDLWQPISGRLDMSLDGVAPGRTGRPTIG